MVGKKVIVSVLSCLVIATCSAEFDKSKIVHKKNGEILKEYSGPSGVLSLYVKKLNSSKIYSGPKTADIFLALDSSLNYIRDQRKKTALCTLAVEFDKNEAVRHLLYFAAIARQHAAIQKYFSKKIPSKRKAGKASRKK